MKRIIRYTFLGMLIGWWFCLPERLFDDPVSVVVEDKDGNLLGARIAQDGQWRFPEMDSVPWKFKVALITFEDKRFYQHPGVDPVSMVRAVGQNLSSGEVVSGGSTLSMQLMRMSRNAGSRTIYQKVAEAGMAVRGEIRYSKEEILALYASHAPFGGNVVGLDAASWRYYGKNPDKLSWAEAATLAVLPNSPALVHPGRNRDKLRSKRNRLLDDLLEEGFIDSLSCELSKQEPLPGNPLDLPNTSPHLTDRLLVKLLPQARKGENTRVRTTLDKGLQERASHVVGIHRRRLSQNGINNACALIVDVHTGDVRAYIGNAPGAGKDNGQAVDVIRARRSTGSILKPFLYAAALSDGELLPGTLVPDVPSYYGSYSPQNYDKTFSGAVPAKMALARSLNIPAIRMLSEYGQVRFYDRLEEIGMKTLNQPAHHYGLSLILGGAEASLWDLAGMYASMARTVNDYEKMGSAYEKKAFRPVNIMMDQSLSAENGYQPEVTEQAPLSASACYLTFEAMLEVSRPQGERFWRNFSSSRRIAWKTGTSYGHRDAWAVGVTPDYVVAVWAGNADGEGRPSLIGVEAAAPLMFDLFNLLPGGDAWFRRPVDDMVEINICSKSGHRALEVCEKTEKAWVSAKGLETKACPYHRWVHLDPSGKEMVSSLCESPFNMVKQSWFVLPPSMESFYKSRHSDYRALPPLRRDCQVASAEANSTQDMEIIYPRSARRIFVPHNLDGTLSSTIFEIAHRDRSAKVYWHLDREFLGSTTVFHQMALNPKPGKHILTLVDENGEELKQEFEIIGRD